MASEVWSFLYYIESICSFQDHFQKLTDMTLLGLMIRENQAEEDSSIRSLGVVHHSPALFNQSFPDSKSERIDIFLVMPGMNLEADIKVIGLNKFKARVPFNLRSRKRCQIKKVLGSFNETFGTVGAPEEPEL